MEYALIVLPYIKFIPDAAFGVMILATIIVRITPSKGDDKKVKLINSKIHKFFSFLPTLGIDPRTRALEEALRSVEEKVPSAEV